MSDFIRSALQTHLYSVQLGVWATTPDSPDGAFFRLYATDDGLKWMDDAGNINPLLNVEALEVEQATETDVKYVYFVDAGERRWSVGATGDTKGGSNTGQDFAVKSYDDNGDPFQECLHLFRANGNWLFGTMVQLNGGVGFNGTSPIAKPTVTGSRGGNAALASLLTALANYGLITDSTTA